jgi:hypothetical protein
MTITTRILIAAFFLTLAFASLVSAQMATTPAPTVPTSAPVTFAKGVRGSIRAHPLRSSPLSRRAFMLVRLLRHNLSRETLRSASGRYRSAQGQTPLRRLCPAPRC